MKEYLCTKGANGCMGYKNGKCITFENCQWKIEQQESYYNNKQTRNTEAEENSTIKH